MEFVHTGRKSGQPYETVAMVLRYDADAREAIICAGWGPDSDWVRNLRTGPAAQVRLGRESFTPQHRFLPNDEAFDVAAGSRREHPRRLRLLRPTRSARASYSASMPPGAAPAAWTAAAIPLAGPLAPTAGS